MKCPKCSKTIEDDSKFCQFCGETIEKNENTKIEEVDKELISHLEFLGYEVEGQDLVGNSQRYTAKHKSRPNLIFNSVPDIGISFVSFYFIDPEKVKKNRDEALEIINRMNNKALFTSFSISPDSNNFVCGALYLGKYSKKEFADFLDLFEKDIQSRLGEEGHLADFT